MEFATTENRTMIAQAVRDLCERELRPHVMEWDESQHFPKELFTDHFGPTFPATASVTRVTDTNAGVFAQRFYRILVNP